jgi:penicillin-binding protein 1C
MNQVSGVTGAGPIFREIFLHLREVYGTTWYEEPSSLVHAKIDPRNGHTLSSQSPAVRLSHEEIFLRNTLPSAATSNDYEPETGNAYVSKDYETWLKHGETSLSRLLALREPVSNMAVPRIITPVDHTVFFLDPDLKDNGNKLLLHASTGDNVIWSSPTLEMIEVSGQHYVKLTPGNHEIIATNPMTHDNARVMIEVREPLSLAQKHSRLASANPDAPVR